MQKQLLRYFGVAILAGTMIFTSCKKDNEATKHDQLVGKWTLVSAIGDYTSPIQYKDTTNFTADEYVQLSADGNIEIHQSDEDYNGKWTLNESDRLVLTETGYMDFPNGFEITKLTSNELQLRYITNTQQYSGTQYLNLKK